MMNDTYNQPRTYQQCTVRNAAKWYDSTFEVSQRMAVVYGSAPDA